MKTSLFISGILLLLSIGCKTLHHSDVVFYNDYNLLSKNNTFHFNVKLLASYTQYHKNKEIVRKVVPSGSYLNFIKKSWYYPSLVLCSYSNIEKMEYNEMQKGLKSIQYETVMDANLKIFVENDTPIYELYGYKIYTQKQNISSKNFNQLYKVCFSKADTNHFFCYLFDSTKMKEIRFIEDIAYSELKSFSINEPIHIMEKIDNLINDFDTFEQKKFNYLPLIKRLKELKNYSYKELNNDEIQMLNSYIASYYSFMNFCNDSTAYYSNANKNMIVDTIREDNIAYSIDSFFSKKEVKESKIIMLNESHTLNSNREIAKAFLYKLKELKFEYIALEAIDYKNDYGTFTDGFYTKSPFYQDLIKVAKELHFKIIAYEDTLPNSDYCNREKNQAQNIIRQVFSLNPNAKLFVYCGFDHIREDTNTCLKLAGWINKLSGNNPITISQSHNFVSKEVQTDKQVVALFKSNNKYDYDLIHPKNYSKWYTKTIKNINDTAKYYLLYDEEDFNKNQYNAIPITNSKIENNEINLEYPRNGKYFLILLSKNYNPLSKEILIFTSN